MNDLIKCQTGHPCQSQTRQNSRHAHAPALRIEDRDLSIFEHLANLRFMTLRQFANLFLEHSSDAARKRLGRLDKAGLVKVRQKKPNVYAITQAGMDVLEQTLFISHCGYAAIFCR